MDELFDLSGKVAVVTGASSGLGRQGALALAQRGAKVIAVARRAEALAKLENDIVQNPSSSGGKADISQSVPSSIRQFAEALSGIAKAMNRARLTAFGFRLTPHRHALVPAT